MIHCEFFEKVSRKKFLQKYWKKRPLLIKAGVVGLDRLLSRSAILRLAGRHELTSRLVCRNFGAKGWDLQFGPFSRAVLQSMPKDNWTVLVQETDHVIEDLNEVRRHFEVTPQWLFDDIMVSFAADKGSVGPHIDQYDVFLIQGFGQRRWRIGEIVEAGPELIDDSPLKILKNFRPTMEWLCEPGDVLYLPPMVPHYGEAVGECSTYSVGFRNVTEKELIESLIERVSLKPNENTLEVEATSRGGGRAELSSRDLRQLRLRLASSFANSEVIADAIGVAMTFSRRGFHQELLSGRTPSNRSSKRYIINPDARLVYFKEPGIGQRFYGNGARIDIPKKLYKIMASFFDQRQLDLGVLKAPKLTMILLRRQLTELIALGLCSQVSSKKNSE